MKSISKIFALILVLGVTSLNVSCSSDDDNTPAAPLITFPSNGQQYEVNVGGSFTFTFLVKADGGYDSHTLESTTNAGIIAADNSSIPDGDKDFEITGVYTAGQVAGPDVSPVV